MIKALAYHRPDISYLSIRNYPGSRFVEGSPRETDGYIETENWDTVGNLTTTNHSGARVRTMFREAYNAGIGMQHRGIKVFL